jgi:hypothetical protein
VEKSILKKAKDHPTLKVKLLKREAEHEENRKQIKFLAAYRNNNNKLQELPRISPTYHLEHV